MINEDDKVFQQTKISKTSSQCVHHVLFLSNLYSVRVGLFSSSSIKIFYKISYINRKKICTLPYYFIDEKNHIIILHMVEQKHYIFGSRFSFILCIANLEFEISTDFDMLFF